MTTVQQLLDEKGHDVWSILPDDSVSDAIQLVARENVGALVVMEDDRPVGIFTERHCARNVFPMGKSSPKTRTREIMNTDVSCARPEQTVEEYMALMIEIGSERGKALLDHLPRWDATPAGARSVRQNRDQQGSADASGRRPGSDAAQSGASRWDEVAERCLRIDNCTVVCPTYFARRWMKICGSLTIWSLGPGNGPPALASISATPMEGAPSIRSARGIASG